MLHRLLLKLGRRTRLQEDLEAELTFHREMSGLHQNPIRLGNISGIKEQAYDLWRFNILENFWRDLVYGARGLSRTPTLLICALLCLAFGAGANTAIFELLDALRLRTLPVERPEQLAAVQVSGGHGGMGVNPGEYPELTRPIWRELESQQQAFSGMFAWISDQVNIGQGSGMHRVKAMWVSKDAFEVLGLRPWKGRLLSREDDGPCPGSTAVVSYAYWQGAMGGTPIDGSSNLPIDGVRKRVVGVEPPDFAGLSIGDRIDIVLPLCRPKEMRRDVFDIAVMGRLKPGWSVKRASEELQALSPGIFEATVPAGRSSDQTEAYKRFRLTASSAASGVSLLREQYSSSLWLLLAVSGLVLLMGCANLANLLLARATTRDREMSVRLALGASGKRLISQLLAEGALLAAGGAVLGIWLAHFFSSALVWALSTEGNVVALPIAIDWRVLGFTFGVSAFTCLFFTALPARRAVIADPITAMKAGGRSLTGTRERGLMQQCLVVGQISVSLLLLAGGILFIRSFRNLMTFDPGMREAHITVIFIAFDHTQVNVQVYKSFERELVEDVRSAPGVLNAASTTNVPLTGGSWEHGVHAGSQHGVSKFTWVSPTYFDTMRIPLIMGRQFGESDRNGSQPVAIVNRTFVQRYLGDVNPIGHELRTDAEPNYPSTTYRVVGVIPDTKYNDVRGVTPAMVFAPAAQFPDPGPFAALVVYSNLKSAAVVSSIQHIVEQRHPGVVATGGDFEQWIHDGFVRDRLMATLFGIFGLVGAVLAVIGLYGVISYVVVTRRSEIGVRMALGATRPQVIGMTMKGASRLLLIGCAVGILFVLIAGHVANALLFGLKSYDPVSLGAATLLLSTISGLASFLPAWRASKLDPMIALRYE